MIGIIFTIGFFGAVVVAIVFVFGKNFKSKQAEKKYNQAQSERTYSGNTQATITDEQRVRLDYLREQQKQRTAVEKHELHVKDAHEHAHTGEEEHYEEIVGSLGDINDEGCEDLNGVRFIAHDLAYAPDDDETDYTGLAKAMVLGEIINTPRFKSPHSRK